MQEDKETLNRKLISRANKDELIQWCIDRGIEVKEDDRVTDLRNKLRDKLGLHERPVVHKGVKIFSGEDEVDKEKEFKPVKVIIASTTDDKHPVYAGVNGRSYVIQRDVEATIPYCVYRTLVQAVTGKLDAETNKVSNSPLYSVSLVG